MEKEIPLDLLVEVLESLKPDDKMVINASKDIKEGTIIKNQIAYPAAIYLCCRLCSCFKKAPDYIADNKS